MANEMKQSFRSDIARCSSSSSCSSCTESSFCTFATNNSEDKKDNVIKTECGNVTPKSVWSTNYKTKLNEEYLEKFKLIKFVPPVDSKKRIKTDDQNNNKNEYKLYPIECIKQQNKNLYKRNYQTNNNDETFHYQGNRRWQYKKDNHFRSHPPTRNDLRSVSIDREIVKSKKTVCSKSSKNSSHFLNTRKVKDVTNPKTSIQNFNVTVKNIQPDNKSAINPFAKRFIEKTSNKTKTLNGHPSPLFRSPVKISQPELDFAVQEKCNNRPNLFATNGKATKVFEDLCHRYFLAENCQVKNCQLSHIFPAKFENSLQNSDYITLMKSYEWVKGTPLFKSTFKYFIDALSARNKKPEIAETALDVFDQHWLSHIEGIELIIKGLQNTSLTFQSSIEYLILRHGNRNIKLTDLLIEIITNETEHFKRNWYLIDRLLAFRTEPMDFIVVNNIIGNSLSADPPNLNLIGNIYDAIISKNLVDLRYVPKFLYDSFIALLSLEKQKKSYQ